MTPLSSEAYIPTATYRPLPYVTPLNKKPINPSGLVATRLDAQLSNASARAEFASKVKASAVNTIGAEEGAHLDEVFIMPGVL